ncbi:hypothetical protein FA95DRAFT_1559485 [Auriscalpium vulgare]|uniref:Uncharacterized protein n=1 Tax=Auriscalpium vulgare TaxID=40419 RepID=A0ACB8RT31_9AGAM|nr:hypothetical protein FA95DRAFT_1559485 [Auriscalpium vulgare]
MAWYPRLEKLKLRYGEWLHTHRKPFRSRQATGHSRDIGQKTGKWDDKLDAPGPNDDYKHDGFVVSDADDSEEEDEDEVDYATEGDARPDNDGGEWQQARPGEEDTSGEESAQTTSDADSDSSTEGGHYTFLEPRKAILVKHGRELPYTPLLSTPQRTSRRPDRRREDDRDKDETDVEDTPTKASTSGTRVTEITHHPRDVPLEELFTPEGSSDGSSSGESRPRKRKEESDKESDEGQPQRTRRRTGTPASSSAHPEDARARRGRRDTGAR